ncbi:MAG: hypothetical protein MUP69_10300 [Candidatus Atribacteria bacterium]|nr:hypothetical protein [Candidatus Atribacteria bacterium]
MRKNRIIITILICLLLLPVDVFAVPTYGKVGADANFNGDVGIPSGSKYYINGIAIAVGDIAGAAASGANTDITSLNNTSLKVGRDADNLIDFTTDNKIIFRTNGADQIEILSTGELDMNDASVGFTLQTLTGDGTDDIDWRLGIKFAFTFTDTNEVITFTHPTNPCNLTLQLKQDAVGSRTVTFDDDVWFPGGTHPTLTTTANAVDTICFFYNGTNFLGMSGLDFK